MTKKKEKQKAENRKWQQKGKGKEKKDGERWFVKFQLFLVFFAFLFTFVDFFKVFEIEHP